MTSTTPLEVGSGFPEDWWDQFEMPEGYHRVEIIQGELVLTPAPVPAHGVAIPYITQVLGRNVPAGYAVATGVEWALPGPSVLVARPVPDVMVIPRAAKTVVDPPLLAVEVLSPSDLKRWGEWRWRIEAKRADYAACGLQHYLEVVLAEQGGPMVARYELQNDRLVNVEEVNGTDVLQSTVPYPYYLRPSEL